MAKTAQDVLRQIKDEGIELIDLKFVDLHGKWQHLTVCEDLIDEAAFTEGDIDVVQYTLQKPTAKLL